ncbi:MAG: phosphotransferase [Desulfobulbaceae bacterium]|nr:phosphotransferase [Desulfobulbaceae bacterium]
MEQRLSEGQRQALINLLHRQGFAHGQEWRPEWLAGDGSDRIFCRVRRHDGATWLAVVPGTHPKGLAEARAGFSIGRHLAARRVPVPLIHDFDEATGIILCEDLGDQLFHSALAQMSAPEKERLYREAIDALILLQVEGREGFDPSWCWDTPRYDQQLMLARESGYFRDAFCSSLLGITTFAGQLDAEFGRLAALAGEQPADYLLHRDFQCRNLMLAHGAMRIIDFQGARFGPLGYDLASLLLDPYAGLDGELQDQLRAYYATTVSRYINLDRHSFDEGYYYLFLQRNLQILGAFAFLSQQRGKIFFRRFLLPALSSLAHHLAKPQGAAFPSLRALVDDSRSRLEKHS